MACMQAVAGAGLGCFDGDRAGGAFLEAVSRSEDRRGRMRLGDGLTCGSFGPKAIIDLLLPLG